MHELLHSLDSFFAKVRQKPRFQRKASRLPWFQAKRKCADNPNKFDSRAAGDQRVTSDLCIARV